MRNKRFTGFLLALFVLLSMASVFAALPNTQMNPYINPSIEPNHEIPLESTYVANSNTGKFHYSYCRYVGMMSPSHKVFYDSREEAIDDGYIPCKVCKP